MKTKICSKCNEEKSLTEFYNDKTHRSGKTNRCKDCHRTGPKCTVCGEHTSKGGSHSEQPVCHACRRKTHGATGYVRGCRCDICRKANADSNRKYVRAYAIRQRGYEKAICEGCGIQIRRPSFCGPCGLKKRGKRGTWISTERRLALYERDGWTCQLCMGPVRRDGISNHRDSATLDHIIPWSWVDEPDNSDENLRLACHSCNSKRGAALSEKEAYYGKAQLLTGVS